MSLLEIVQCWASGWPGSDSEAGSKLSISHTSMQIIRKVMARAQCTLWDRFLNKDTGDKGLELMSSDATLSLVTNERVSDPTACPRDGGVAITVSKNGTLH